MNRQRNEAYALVKGGKKYPGLMGKVTFVQMNKGVLVTAEILGLPIQNTCCNCGVFGFHIHEGTSCSGNQTDEFANALGHYNPNSCQHPYHAGDMPPLFGNNGYAYMSFLTNRFRIEDVVGRVVIIHADPDDFKTQPNGNSGTMIACGRIVR